MDQNLIKSADTQPAGELDLINPRQTSCCVYREVDTEEKKRDEKILFDGIVSQECHEQKANSLPYGEKDVKNDNYLSKGQSKGDLGNVNQNQ